jgi:hypothetical protein
MDFVVEKTNARVRKRDASREPARRCQPVGLKLIFPPDWSESQQRGWTAYQPQVASLPACNASQAGTVSERVSPVSGFCLMRTDTLHYVVVAEHYTSNNWGERIRVLEIHQMNSFNDDLCLRGMPAPKLFAPGQTPISSRFVDWVLPTINYEQHQPEEESDERKSSISLCDASVWSVRNK